LANSKKNNHIRTQIAKLLAEYSVADIISDLQKAGITSPLSIFDDSPEEKEMLEEIIDTEDFLDEDSQEYILLPKMELLTMLFSAELEERYRAFDIDENFPQKSAKILSFPKSKSIESTFQLKITIKGSSPHIWRVIEFPSNQTLLQLHTAIQTSFDWEDSHLHEFIINGKTYGSSMEDDSYLEESDYEPQESDFDVSLQSVVTHEKSHFSYRYDFENNWELSIEVEKIIHHESTTPKIISGERMAPPENAAGIAHFEYIHAIAQNKSHKEFKSIRPIAFEYDLVDGRGKWIEPEFTKTQREERNGFLVMIWEENR